MSKANLQKWLEIYDADIKNNPNDDKAYYKRATILIDIRDSYTTNIHNTTFSERISKDALHSFNNAIRLTNSTNSLYLADRSMLYIDLNKIEAALADVETIRKLSSINHDEIGSICINIKVDDIMALIKWNKLYNMHIDYSNSSF